MRNKKLWKLRQKTLEIHGGGDFSDRELRPVVDRVAAYPLGSFERGRRLFAGEERGFIYTRINNRTVDRLERRIAALEGGEAGLATSSGMSAILIISLYLAHGGGPLPRRSGLHPREGGHIVSSNRLYGGVLHLFRELLPKLGIPVTLVENPYDLREWERAIRPNTKFLALENPSNPMIDLFDPRPLVRLAHKQGAKFVVDSTLATPVLMQPLKQGADIVWHSLSKYFGDGEVIGGCIVGKKRLIDDIRLGWFRTLGPCMSPDNAAIFLSHAESLFGRVTEHSKNTLMVARFLSKHPKVRRVFYPAFGSHARENKKIMPKGFGGLMAFEIKGGRRDAKKVLESLRLFWHAPNIGESRSLVVHPASTTHGQLTSEELKKAGITQGTLRLSVGREDPRDLIEDLRRALAKV